MVAIGFSLLFTSTTAATTTTASSSSNCTCAPTDNAVDCAALCDLYLATGSRLAGGWGSGTPLCSWGVTHGDMRTGVACLSGATRPTQLVLEQLTPPLQGTLPPSLANLTTLTKISVWQNELKGVLPPRLGEGFTRLTSLNFDNNHFVGTIPATLGNATRLTALGLSDNQLSGTLPPSLGALTNLTVLWSDGNSLSGTIPPELGSIGPTLRFLDLSNNTRLSGTIPSSLLALIGLTTLDFNQCALSGSIPSGGAPRPGAGVKTLLKESESESGSDLSWSAFTSLSWIDLHGGNNLTGILPTALCELLADPEVECNFDTAGFRPPIPSGCAKCTPRHQKRKEREGMV